MSDVETGAAPGAAHERRREIGLHWDLSKAIIAAFFSVRRELGPFFPEHVYVNAVAAALRESGIASAREVPYEVVYHGVVVGVFRADLIVDDKVLVETKIAPRITAPHRRQAWHYLHASGLKVAMILNCGDPPGTARVEVP